MDKECSTCTDRLNYISLSEKYDQLESRHEVLLQDNLTYEEQIAELEKKLKETEKELEIVCVEGKDKIREFIETNSEAQIENQKLKQQLADKEEQHIKDKIYLLEFLKANFADVYLTGVMKTDNYDRSKYSRDVDSIIDREIKRLKEEL